MDNHSSHVSGLLKLGAAAVLTLGVGSCRSQHDVNVNVAPIFMTLDVNIRVDRQLDEFFAFENQYRQTQSAPPAGGGDVQVQ
jgi:hypothetical protein